MLQRSSLMRALDTRAALHCALLHVPTSRYYKPETRGLDFEGLMEDVQVGCLGRACWCCRRLVLDIVAVHA